MKKMVFLVTSPKGRTTAWTDTRQLGLWLFDKKDPAGFAVKRLPLGSRKSGAADINPLSLIYDLKYPPS